MLCFALIATCSALTAADPPVVVEPVLQRVDVAFGAERSVHLAVRSHVAGSLIAVDTDCSCIHPATALPLTLAADQAADLELRVTGVGSGMKPVTVRTTAGATTITLQVVTAGAGVGKDQLAAAARRAVERRDSAVLLVHDLRGQLRNCGCSAGSLGGIDRLAALPEAWRALAGGVAARFVLTGDTDGSAIGVGDALVAHGWQRGDPAIVVTDDVEVALTQPGLSAVIPTKRTEIRHRRLVRPTLDGGMTITVLLLGADGEIDEQRVIPVDQTLTADADILAAFPERLTHEVVSQPSSDACLACHGAAHATWSASAHARAWAALTVANRTDACVGCHSTPVDGGALTGGVHCQDCHAGGAAHAADPAAARTTAIDCRTCHDARHHPEFDRVRAWQVIAHGR